MDAQAAYALEAKMTGTEYWEVRIAYLTPRPAGPCVGTVKSTDGWVRNLQKPKRGDIIRGMFGLGRVTAIKRAK